MHRFTLRQLEYLVTAIDCRSIAGAAEKLNVSQPTISVAISKLEDQIGTQLLLRHHSQGVTRQQSDGNNPQLSKLQGAIDRLQAEQKKQKADPKVIPGRMLALTN